MGSSCPWEGPPTLWQFSFCTRLPTDCLAYTQFQLRVLIRLRFVKSSDWPEDLELLGNALDTASQQQWSALLEEQKEVYLSVTTRKKDSAN